MTDDPLIGRRLANFEIERPLGRGGMAQVYYGQDVKLRRPVAIKIIDARYRDKPAYAERFVREAQTIATWRHENIIQIYYADDQDGFYYFVMEYIDGDDLSKILAKYKANDQQQSYEEVLRIGRAIGSALDYAHNKGIIHRDVKPSNVMIAKDGRVVLMDFGLAMDAEMGSMGEVFGSAHYIAPEQARNSGSAVPQSDLYSLGIILYQMLTGRVPFDDPSSTTVAVQHLTMAVPPPHEINPDLSPAIEAVLLKALSKSPEDRYQSGLQLMNALEASFQTDDATIASPLLKTAVSKAAPIAAVASVSPAVETTADKRPLFYVGIGVTAALGVIILLALALTAFFLLRDADDATGQTALETASTREAATSELAVPSTEPSTEALPPTDAQPASDPPPAASPTEEQAPTPEPVPQVLADTVDNFGSNQNGVWRYTWSPPGEDNWKPLVFEDRRYGTCWYAEDYIRICADGVHPGNGADVAWYWVSDVSGQLEIQISASKLDSGGDGVVVAIYQNTLNINGKAPLFQRTLAGRDKQGFAETIRINQVKPEDSLLVIVNHNGDATSDYTAVQARICHYSCP
ncbi:MAG: protein kinase [Anaerolineae bacterium]|nr:protein kinase [Anaerolineae bacterium]